MKRIITASKEFNKATPEDQVPFGNSVCTCLGNVTVAENFPNLPVPVKDLQDANDLVAKLLSDAKSGSHVSVADLKAAVKDWKAKFTKTSTYIGMVSDQSISMIRSAGFVPTKGETTPGEKPGLADIVATINGSKGALKTYLKKKVPGSKVNVVYAYPEGTSISFNGDTMIVSIGENKVYINVFTKKLSEFVSLPSQKLFNVAGYCVNSSGAGSATDSQQVTTQ